MVEPAVPCWEDSEPGPAFRYPWEGRAFALVVRLAESGLFTWSEWVDCLASQVRAADGADGPNAYADQWISAVEALLVRKGVTSAEQLRARRLACWPMELSHEPIRADVGRGGAAGPTEERNSDKR